MMEYTEKKYSRYGLISTILFHALLLILFLLFGLKVPVPLPQQSVVINFGTSAEGTGVTQPTQPSPQQQNPNPAVAEQEVTPQENTPDEVVTQEAESPVSAPDPKEDPKKSETEKKPERQVNQQALFPGKSSKQGGGGSEGETGKAGDQGDPSGDPSSLSHTGGLDGSGNSYSLGMRKALVKPKPDYDCPEEGKVVVTIAVDRTGKVIKATAGGRGTTNAAPCLLNKAREAAMQTRWEADAEAPELQSGQIIYKFELR